MVGVLATLSVRNTLLAGAGGALLWVLLVHGLPLANKASKGKLAWTPSVQAIGGIVALLVIYVVLGAIAAWLTAASTAKDAVIYGLGWQGVFGQFLKPPDGGL